MTELADIDRQLEELGSVPEDLAELLARYGEDDRSEQHLDGLLTNLSDGVEPPQVEALGVESVPPPAEPAVAATPEPAEPNAEPAPASDSAIPRDTMVDRPSTPVEAEPVEAREMDDDLQAAPEVDALFDDAPAADAAADEEDDVEMSFEDEPGADAELDAATDGLFDTLEDAEPASAAPEAEADSGHPELEGDTDTALSPVPDPDAEARKSDLKALLREEMDPSDFPQTPSSAPPAPAPAGAAAAADDDDDFELLVDEDDIEEIEIDDDELELLDDD